ncbi:MAG: hypothetical protein LKI80_14860 [Sporolactobacillus sp.]|jgi:hypothetical protein|nr:hypothetical protein [Sporolactobacillus sp.]
MILIQCVKDVYGETGEPPLDLLEERPLFKKRNFYMADTDGHGHLITQDEDGEPHVIADGRDILTGDSWFHEHFVLA